MAHEQSSDEETEHLVKNPRSDAQSEAERLMMHLSSGPWVLRILAIIGGVATIFVAITGFLHTSSITGFIVDGFLVVFGAAMVVLELNSYLCTRTCREWLETNFKFVARLFGRGVFYIFTGGLMLSGWAIFPWLVGGYVITVGVVCIFVSIQTKKKLAEFKARLRVRAPRSKDGITDKNYIKSVFNKYDRSNRGTIDKDDLEKLAHDLGQDLTAAELHAAHKVLDINESGQIEFNDFFLWWTSNSETMP